MEEMKNYVIQALETKGLLGQIRAQLRSSVFKIVDDQDQKYNMGCGLKWENPMLYQISETKGGTLHAELIREFMEYFRMDYSLSTFIPECSISPERLKREELIAKLGIKGASSDLPLLNMIVLYFIEAVNKEPERVNEFMKRKGKIVYNI
jgi:FGFR1 oncogene partner